MSEEAYSQLRNGRNAARAEVDRALTYYHSRERRAVGRCGASVARVLTGSRCDDLKTDHLLGYLPIARTR